LIEADIAVITIEDHTLCGGFGAAVLEAANEKKIDTRSIGRIGMPDRWVHHDSRSGQLIETGLDAEGIARQIRHFLDDDGRSSLESRADTVGMPLEKK
jgi:1-deoxy-D-xylulose-5-phosphate synthase